MIIDFHTHIFPDKIAEKTMQSLLAGINYMYTAVHDGTTAGLLKNMDDWGIDKSVVLPIVTRQTQTKNVNEWAAEISSDRLVSFGSIYPHTDDYKRDIDFVSGLGLRGLKFHAEYQNFNADDELMLKIYDYALSKGLIILHHGGLDEAFPGSSRSAPEMFARVAKEMKGGVIIAAHLGGYKLWDDVEEYLAGSDIYFDTSMGFDYYTQDQFLRIVKKHGTDKILFASDSPWSNAKTEAEHIMGLPLTDDEKSAILSGNALRILNV
jgi:predicted TIM-barrel fold metal-dependent hydrolase